MGEQSRNEIKAAHLGFIESAIMRMGQNSLQAKSWCITLTVALITFYAANDTKFLVCHFLAVLGIIDCVFFAIDVYYFRLERRYRSLYKVVAELKSNCDVTVRDYDMDIPKEIEEQETLWKAILSISTLVVYVLLGCCQLLMLALLMCK